MIDRVTLLIYFTPMLLILFAYIRRQNRHHAMSLNVRKEAIEAGLTEPASLHPVIDPTKCIGCSSCIAACPEMPEHKVIGIIHRKAELINPTECIGHGACLTACPHGAITLVFGTERRGVDIPQVKPNFETNVPGIYIAGELGGMGLIRNAIEQGRQAMQSVIKDNAGRRDSDLDVVIIGAGPAGFSASLAALEHKLRFVTLEQEALGGAVAHYPRGKIVMTAPAVLPKIGKMKFRETTKEKLMEFWHQAEKQSGIEITYGEHVEAIVRHKQDLEVKTGTRSYRTKAVILAIGRRGTPRKLGVPGEDLPKVTYRLVDPDQYINQHVLVVGGGDSALEAAIVISAAEGTDVTLSYRSDAFSRAKKKNREKIEAVQNAGKVRILFRSNVIRINPDTVEIDHDGKTIELPNDAVIVNAGGILPTAFLKSIGIEVETKFGTP